jgi:hypothetical protein
MAELPPIEDVVDRALALIRPRSKQRAACVADIRTSVEMLRPIVAMTPPSPGVLKAELRDIHTQLLKTRKVLQPSWARALIFSANPSQIPPADPETGAPATRPLFLDQLDQLIDAAEFSRDALRVPRGSKPWDVGKAEATRQARTLLATHGPAKPQRGVPDKLASLLYEAATGETGVNLRQYRRAGDRTEPGIVMRVAPRKRKPSR